MRRLGRPKKTIFDSGNKERPSFKKMTKKRQIKTVSSQLRADQVYESFSEE